MMKVKLLFLVIATIGCLSGCSKTCKIEGCKDETYKEGLCQKHYYINQGADAVEGVVSGLMDIIK
ncbi:MAG: hypothetical protein HFE83_09885 [Lachnospiraceae bacterium]|nr:hypothetical protein [Lachnospiraceae bacterium]